MRRRSHQHEMANHDYVSVSQDPENPSDKRAKSVLPRSYNARRRLALCAICAVVGLGLFVVVRLVDSGSEPSEGTIVMNNLLPLSCLMTRHSDMIMLVYQ